LPLFFLGRITDMMDDEASLLSEAERRLKEKFSKEVANRRRIPSTASDARSSERVDLLTLPDNERGRMPFTKDKFLVKENPHLVQWEREVRKFLRNLSPEHGHRIAAVMVYEWATGVLVKDIMAEEQGRKVSNGTAKPHTTWRSDLRKINQILRFYFGKPYMTYICGRKVPKAYRVKPGYYIRRHRPMTLTLYSEYIEGSLYP